MFSKLYWILVALAAAWVAFDGLTTEPAGDSLLGWTPRGWQPGWGSVVFWTACVGCLAGTVYRPAVAVGAYLFVEYSSSRYAPHLEFVMTHRLLDLIAILGALGTAVWWRRRTEPSRSFTLSQRMLCGWMAAIVAWCAVSVFVELIRYGAWEPSIRHSPLRYLNAGLLFFVTAFGCRERSDFLGIVAALTAALLWRVVQFPATTDLDGDLGLVSAILVPLTLLSSVVVQVRLLKMVPWLTSLYLSWLVIDVRSRGAGAGWLAGLLVAWALSFRKWAIAAAAIPLAVLGGLGIVYSGFWHRIQGSLPGGTAYGSVEERLVAWKAALSIALEHWCFGVGPGAYGSVVERYNAQVAGMAAHNSILAVLAEQGIPGAVLYLGFFLAALMTAARVGRRSAGVWPAPAARGVAAALAVYLIAGMFITRHDQALAYALVGLIAGWAGMRPVPADSTDRG